MTDERRTAGRPPLQRRPGGKSFRGTLIRLPDDLHDLMEREVANLGTTKVAIVEDALRRRYSRLMAA